MINVIKKGILFVSAIILAILLTLLVTVANKFQITPQNVYKVYLDGKVIGNIKDKKELEDYINEEQKDLKDKYKVEKVYVPAGVDIQKCKTYEKKLLTAKEVHSIIKKEKPFTIKGYKVTLKPTTEDEEKIIINVLDKKMFDNAIKQVLEAFVSKDDIKNFKNGTQPEIKETGSLIEDIYVDQDITLKKGFISVNEKIFIDEKELTKYLLFGEIKDDQFYTVKDGDTIDSIAYDNKLSTAEFLIVNPEFTSSKNLLSVGQNVKVGLINPIVDIVVESHTILDQESKYKTVTEKDPNMNNGQEKVIVEGQNGMNRLTTKLKNINGKTTNVVIVSSEVITPSVDKVVKVGTKSWGGGGYAPIMSGSWAWPTISQYYISSPFGYRWGKLHEAIDIAGSGEGSPIYAAQSGIVEAAKRSKSVGNHVVINHQNGYYTLYAHLRDLMVTNGQHVEKGQQIGTMGHTGFATGTHLHFGVYRNGYPYRGGTPINPLLLYK